MNKLKFAAIGVIAMFAVIVVLQNTQNVETKLRADTISARHTTILTPRYPKGTTPLSSRHLPTFILLSLDAPSTRSAMY